jgi:hypothetical protein
MPNSIPDDFFYSVLQDNEAAIPLGIEKEIRKTYPNKYFAATGDLELHEFVRKGFATSSLCAKPHPYLNLYWGGLDHDRLYPSCYQATWQVEWNSHSLLVLQARWSTSCGGEVSYWVIADEPSVPEAFILDVSRKTNEPDNSVFVFQNGRWSRSHDIFTAISSTQMSDLVLPADRRDQMIGDFKRFLRSESQYQALGIAWRRGAILIGPPGNGKTHFLRALVNELDIPCLYVQSLADPYREPEQLLERIFDRCREIRPCILIFEDLDSLIDENNRSYFLNQLDGFERNHGLIIVATTNHPEKIDSAILDRPSRFDRKYEFPLPEYQQRAEFLGIWKEKLRSSDNLACQWDGSNIPKLAEKSEGFSFAYLKELMISSLLQLVHQSGISPRAQRVDNTTDTPHKTFEQILEDQLSILQEQRRSSH